MSQTLIGIFDSPKAAGEAIEKLINQGFDKADISVMQNSPTDESNSPIEYVDSEDGITHFFKNVFSNDDNRAEDFAKAAKNGTTVTIINQSDYQSLLAVNILDDCGAKDVEEKARESRSHKAVEEERDLTILPDMDADITVARRLVMYNVDIETDSGEQNQGIRTQNNIANKSSENSVPNMLNSYEEDANQSQESDSLNSRSNFRNRNITWNHD